MVRTKKKATKASKEREGGAGEGAAQIRELSDELTAEGASMAAHLTEKALRGKKSVDAWMGLAHMVPRDNESEAKASGFSQALAWEAESEWQGESSEADAETAAGSREPEYHFN